MQLPGLVLLLLGLGTATALTCHYKIREAPTVDALHDGDWHLPRNSTCIQSSHVCSHWLVKKRDGFRDFYTGCHDERVEPKDRRTPAVLHYCGDPANVGCFRAPYMELRRDPDTLVHEPAYLCCCYTPMCETPDMYDFAKQSEATEEARPKSPDGHEKIFTCEVSMRAATRPEGLRDAEPQNAKNETLVAVWAPCVEFVYRAADGQWRQWRAASPYQYSGVSYKSLVERFCTAPNKCDRVDMVEPGSYAGNNKYRLTQAYACCRGSVTDWSMPDTVAFAMSGTTPFAGYFPLVTRTSTPPTPTPASAGGVVWPWLLAIGALLIVFAGAVVCLVCNCRKTEPTEQPRAKDTRALTVSVLPGSAASSTESKVVGPPIKTVAEPTPTPLPKVAAREPQMSSDELSVAQTQMSETALLSVTPRVSKLDTDQTQTTPAASSQQQSVDGL